MVDYFSAGDWKLPVLWNTSRSAGANTGRTQLVARAMVRGQGQTAGYHERVIPLRPRTVRAFGASGGAADLEDHCPGPDRKGPNRPTHPQSCHPGVSGPRGGVRPPSGGPSLARLWLDQLDKIVGRRFFEDLQDEFDLPDQAQRREKNLEWQRWLAEQARQRCTAPWTPCPVRPFTDTGAGCEAEGSSRAHPGGTPGLPEIRDRRGEGVTE